MFPRQYFYHRETDLVAVNGSSSNGECSNFALSTTRQTCSTSYGSILFNGIFTLTGLDGDMWASQLLTINTTANTADITFNFTDTLNYIGTRRVEVVMFNCPEWRISVRTISLFSAPSTSGSRTFETSISPTTTSCDSLVRVCISSIVSSTRPVLTLVFTPPSTSNWVHIAETIFYYASGPNCPPETIITPPPTTPEMNTPQTTITPPPTTPEMIVTATTRTEEVTTRTTREITTGKLLNKPSKV